MWFFIIFTIIAIIGVIIFIVNKNIDEKVASHSKRIKELRKLNDSTPFYGVSDKRTVSKHYDNKSNFLKIEPSYIMTADIKDNLNYFKELHRKIKENQARYPVYLEKVKQISSVVTEEECKELRISWSSYTRREEKFFKKFILSPTRNFTYTVVMSYSSPKGKVNLSKEESFNLQNVFNCMESVARSKLDKATYQSLAKVTRGEVSDSLRYDVMNRDGFKCVICGASAKEGAHLHVDHIIPVSKGGTSTPSNLRTLCERCNIGKSNKIETSPHKQATPKQDTPKQNTPKQDTPKQEKMICPQCGGELRVRTSQYGHFYGCSNYPKCRYTRNIPEK